MSTEPAVWAKVAEAHRAMWADYVCPRTGQVYTFVDPATRRPRLPSVADIEAGRPNPNGWGTGIENCALDGGAYLGAMVDRLAVTGEPEHASQARTIYRGLALLARSARRRGGILRGVVPDRLTHYSDSSVDQYTLYVYGLWRYFRADSATEAERSEIRDITQAVLQRLEADRWEVLSEDGAPVRYGDLASVVPSRAERLLAILLAATDITGDRHWRDLYDLMRDTRLPQCRGVGGAPWVLTQNLNALFLLRHLEPDADVRQVYQAGSLEAAENCLPDLEPRPPRSEPREFMRTVMNPLEAAYAVALTEDAGLIADHLPAIVGVLTAYDYSHSIRGGDLFVGGVRQVECIAWLLARLGFLDPPGGAGEG